mmetsp:Transcript_2022/g.4075  ORF Transcript_2022/g.4075 Transcript_2022/m.4075 type:complete len:167 (+) Transcript_2022:104-604(+)
MTTTMTMTMTMTTMILYLSTIAGVLLLWSSSTTAFHARSHRLLHYRQPRIHIPNRNNAGWDCLASSLSVNNNNWQNSWQNNNNNNNNDNSTPDYSYAQDGESSGTGQQQEQQQTNTRFSKHAPDPNLDAADFRAQLRENVKADLERRRNADPNRGNQIAKSYLDSL